ncbi:hypothetical protein NUW58_g10452 [Xylaria curta]|uniref:Uncharacterized protein n=1 Tax=Xylaria curta TaxID=42375 RepID=A0ACC1MLD1_9PEZI|nr:hypothetical protein NUW58_g10452 [Xylaria curta]
MDASKSPTTQQQESSTRRRRVSVSSCLSTEPLGIVQSSLRQDGRRDSCDPSPSFPSSGPSYDSLMNYKRSNDPNSMARRASLNEQKPQSGFFGSMWQKYVPVSPAHPSSTYLPTYLPTYPSHLAFPLNPDRFTRGPSSQAK